MSERSIPDADPGTMSAARGGPPRLPPGGNATATRVGALSPFISPNTLGKGKGPTAVSAVGPFVTRCRRQDLNLHSLDGNQALNLARLPIPPLRRRGRSYYRSAPAQFKGPGPSGRPR